MLLTKIYTALFDFKGMRDEDIKKGNVIDIIENVVINTKRNTISNFDIFIDYATTGNLTSEQKKKMAKVLKTIGLKRYNDIDTSMQELKGFIMELLDGLEDIKAVVIDVLPDDIDVEVMSARETGILGTVTIFSSVIFALEDLALYLLYVINDEKFIYPVKNKEFVKDLVMISANYKELRGECKNIVKDLRKLDDELEVADKTSFDTHADAFNSKFSIGTNGFLGNPLFILQKAWIDFRIDRMDAMKAKKSLFELKINNLKNKNAGGKDLQTEQAIEYFEERIAKYEREIKAFEEDV